MRAACVLLLCAATAAVQLNEVQAAYATVSRPVWGELPLSELISLGISRLTRPDGVLFGSDRQVPPALAALPHAHCLRLLEETYGALKGASPVCCAESAADLVIYWGVILTPQLIHSLYLPSYTPETTPNVCNN